MTDRDSMTTGASAGRLAKEALASAGFADVRTNRRMRGLGLSVVVHCARISRARLWYFDLAGTNSAYRGGMAKAETVWRALGRAHVMASHGVGPLVILTDPVAPAGHRR